MVSHSTDERLVYDIRLSTVGPATSTGSDVVYVPSSLDLAMKLHYIKGVYFFSGKAAQEVGVAKVKEAMFWLFNVYYMTCGRFKRFDSGQFYINCNDCGARFVEARSDETVEDWIGMREDLVRDLLVYHQPIGPEISFSPLVLFQLTRFKCGGFSLGFSWSHVLGDAFSASDFIIELGHFMSGHRSIGVMPNSPLMTSKSEKPSDFAQPVNQPNSVKRVDKVSDLWIPPNNRKMKTLSLQLNTAQITRLQEAASIEKPFESICAVIWRCIARARGGGESDPRRVTICKKNLTSVPTNLGSREYDKNILPRNSQVINSVEASFPVVEADVKVLASLLVDKSVDERTQIEQMVEEDNSWVCDFVLYGSNLTFVNLEDVGLYGLELNGLKPRFAYYDIQGVGEGGAVVVLPRAKDSTTSDCGEGRFVSITLLEVEMTGLKSELKSSGFLLEANLE